MSKSFYPRLAFQNLKKNSKYYTPYIITGIISVAMFFNLYSFTLNDFLNNVSGRTVLKTILSFTCNIVMLFLAIFLFYTQSFLTKHRKKEFGLYNILGMEKKHIYLVSTFESVYVTVISLVIGLGLGALLSKFLTLILLKLLHLNMQVDFQFIPKAFYITIILFVCIYTLILLHTIRQIHKSKTIELLHGENVGEKEPKTKWITTIIGLITLGAGYYIAITTESPLKAIKLFMTAVVLVIIGTYCLFTSGSITLLKSLKKNKKYYYQTKHFVSVSGMIYRMKQNAVGLANICILSTCVLVVISTTASLYGGMNDIIRTRYPRNIMISTQNVTDKQCKSIDNEVDKNIKNHNIDTKKVVKLRYYDIGCIQSGNSFKIPKKCDFTTKGITNLRVIPLSEYNKTYSLNEKLKKDEVLLQNVSGEISGDTIKCGNINLHIKKNVKDFDTSSSSLAFVMNTYYIVVPDNSYIEKIYNNIGTQEAIEEYKQKPNLYYDYMFDVKQSNEEQIKLYNDISKSLKENTTKNLAPSSKVECAAKEHGEFYQIYGGLLFIGLYVGLTFLIATILTIYYKQISEGYDDKNRFDIMQKVGMSKQETKKSINSQVLTVFFLPLITAFIHVCFAFPLLKRCLVCLNLTNINVFIIGTLITCAIFTVLYSIVYSLTSKIYYKIVSK